MGQSEGKRGGNSRQKAKQLTADDGKNTGLFSLGQVELKRCFAAIGITYGKMAGWTEDGK